MLIKVTGGRVTVNDPSPRVIKLASTGPAGPAGTVIAGFGAWSATSFPLYSCVSYQGSSYISNAATASTDEPGVSSKWVLLASKGSTGSQGPAGTNGTNGSAGATGPQPVFSSTPTVSTLSAGSSATASITGSGTSGSPYVLALGIPQGNQSVFGSPTVSSLSTGSSPTATISGSGTAASPYVLALGIPTGATGAQGPQGATGSLDPSGVTANNSSTTNGYARVRATTQGLVTYGDNVLQAGVYAVTPTSTYGRSVGAPIPTTTSLAIVTGSAPVYLPAPTTAGQIMFIRNNNTSTSIAVYPSTGTTTVAVSASTSSKSTRMVMSDGTTWLNIGSTSGGS
jgi:hypothetical protein